jgi:hypothetical protein
MTGYENPESLALFCVTSILLVALVLAAHRVVRSDKEREQEAAKAEKDRTVREREVGDPLGKSGRGR